MDPNTGRIIQRPADMSDEDWQKFCEERGLVQMTQQQLAERLGFRSDRRSSGFTPAGPPNRHARRAAASRERRGGKT